MASILDFLNPQQQQGLMSSLLNPQQQQQQMGAQGLMGLAQGLLAASGPSRMPVSMGQALGAGLKGMQDSQDSYMDRAYKNAVMNMQMQKLKSGGDKPSSVQEWEYFSALPADKQKQYLGMKRAAQIMNLGDQMAVRDPMGGVMETYSKGISPDSLPSTKGAQAAAVNAADLQGKPAIAAATKVAETNAASNNADKQTVPIIDQLRSFNEGSFDMPYSDTASPLLRVVPNEETQKKVTNLDLLKQARLDLAAPLAKQLGVNPTDKDFQASLDRIFNVNASKESRAAQIDALEQRIRARQAITQPQPTMPPDDASNIIGLFGGGQPAPPATASAAPTTAAPAAGAPMAYPTATNPKTGQKMIFKDGQWQVAQ